MPPGLEHCKLLSEHMEKAPGEILLPQQGRAAKFSRFCVPSIVFSWNSLQYTPGAEAAANPGCPVSLSRPGRA